jgi:hypothetical protein
MDGVGSQPGCVGAYTDVTNSGIRLVDRVLGNHRACSKFIRLLPVRGQFDPNRIRRGVLEAFSLLSFAFTNDPKDHNIFHKVIWLAPLAGAPLFLLVFISRRALSVAMWIVWIADCIGVLAINLEDRTSLFLGVLSALSNAPAIIALLSALIVQYVASSENHETSEPRQSIATK